MNINLFGINHKSAPIEIREQFFLTDIQQDLLLSELKSDPSVVEAFVISTCNRTEIYLHTIDQSPDLFEMIINLLEYIKKITLSHQDKQYFYRLTDLEALKHLLRVTAGLDSLVLGEKQILGQVKSAFEKARERRVLSKQFNLLSQITIEAGKKVQTETNISVGGSSISWAAMMCAEQILGSLTDKSILLIGCGKMSKLTVGQITHRGYGQLFLMNRTPSKADDLAQKCDGIVVPFSNMKETIAKIDLCICAAGAPHYILDKETLSEIRKNSTQKKIVFIDISMPRNIDPQISELPNIDIFHIDDLNKPIESTMLKRQQAVNDVESILDQKLREFLNKLDNFKELVPKD